MAIISALQSIIALILKVWGWASGRAKQKLQNERVKLEEQSRQAQIDGDLDELRRIRGEIEELDHKLQSGDY
jgi:Flp pilus assembly protein TadB